MINRVRVFLKINNKKEPWQIAAGRYFVENSERGFTQKDYKEFILKNYQVSNGQLDQFFNETIFLPTGRQSSRNEYEGKWVPPLEIVSTITDYDELVDARKNARQAFLLSIIAIIISATSLITSWIN